MFSAEKDSPLDMSQRRVKRAESPIPQTPPEPGRRRAKKSSLDSEEMLDLHAKLLSIYRRELDRHAENRAEQAIDEDFYDNIQWDDADAQVLKDRGQLPLVYNVISTSINWVTGTEKRSRMDFKILPRRKQDAKPAERKTALLKYLSDVNRSPFGRSRAFEDAIKVGAGWLECGVEDGDNGDPVYDRYESWRNMLWDSSSVEDDLSDARFVSRSKWVDTDILTAMFPDRKVLIEDSIDENNIYASGIEADGDQAMDSQEIAGEQAGMMREPINSYTRTRARVIEMWFRKPSQVYKMVGGIFGGDLYDYGKAHRSEIHSGTATAERRPAMRMYVALFTARGLLWFGESPYRHNRFPFTPIWAYRRGRDNMPYGMIRGLRDIQQDINKRASKALHILSSNKVVMDEGAVEDIDELAEEISRPDAIIIKKAGKALDINADRDLAPAHLELMSRSIAMIQQQSGVTDELMGRHTNAVSGVAIQRRQDQGSTATTNLFDRLRFAIQVHGEKALSLIEQFYTDQKEFRITSTRGTPEYVTLNSGLPDDDITRTKADFIVSEADWHATLRQASAETLLETVKILAPAAPQVALAFLDLIVENMDIPNRDEIVKRIRQATGLPDPDAEGPTPEQVAAEKEKMAQKALAAAMAQAELAKKAAEASKAQAQAGHAQASTDLVVAQVKAVLSKAVDQNVDAQGKAIGAALQLIASGPAAAGTADQLLREAGFEGEPERAARGAMVAQALDQAIAQQQVPQAVMPQAQDGGGAPGIGAQPQLAEPPAG